MAGSDGSPVPIGQFGGWIIGWLRTGDGHEGLYWEYWNGAKWSCLTDSKRYGTQEAADTDLVGLMLSCLSGEIRSILMSKVHIVHPESGL